MPTDELLTRSTQCNFFDYSLFPKPLSDLPIHSSLLINTINQYSYCLAQKDMAFKQSLQHSDVLLADGIGVVAAARFLTGQKLKKIAGADVHQHLLSHLNTISGSCFYVGSTEQTLKKIKLKLSTEYPNVHVGYFSPPYKADFDALDNKKMISKVNAFHPDVLFVGMTAPKQEKWAYLTREKLDAQIICTIGAVFDFYAGTIERPSKIWIKLGLEWFVRLVKEPKRMWKRYIYYGPIFIGYIVKHKLYLLGSHIYLLHGETKNFVVNKSEVHNSY